MAKIADIRAEAVLDASVATRGGRSEQQGRVWRQAALGFALIAIGALLALPPRIGAWLVVSDPLEQADAVVVFGGQLPYRALEAARIFGEGWAKEAWVTQPPSEETEILRRMDIGYLAEYEWSQRVLTAQGVPPEAIRTVPDTINTAEEVAAVVDRLEAVGGRRAILVSSKFHGRRLRVLWDAFSRNGLEAVVRYTPDDPFEPDAWWTTSRDALAVTRELGGIANAWLGFPLKTRRD